GRTFEEVQNWTVMTPAEKRTTWRRISLEASAWRFNRYSERALEPTTPAQQQPASPPDVPKPAG
ncbi:MAG: Fe-S protein, partial [Rhizobacter sp.]|nr:Fe-S protein [Rhizobacter sp.]